MSGRRTILAIGTGRCGTTVVAKMMLRLGVFMGNRFCQGNEENPEARGEDAEFHEVCKHYVNERACALPSLRQLVNRRNVVHHVWGVKHPNLVFLLNDLVRETTNPVVISCERDHQETIDSMNHFWSCGISKATTWFNEAWAPQKAFIDNPTCPLLRIQFDEQFDDPEGVVDRIVELAGLSPTDAQRAKAIGIPDRSIRRYWSRKTVKVLYLVSKKYLDSKMSRGRFQHMAAVSRHSDVERFGVWGTGFDGYVESESVAANIKRLGWVPDVIHCYKPEDHIGIAEWDGLKSVAYNEAWWPDNRALKEVQEHKIQLVIHHHENDAPRFSGHTGSLVHIPHCADKHVFAGGEDPERVIPCLMSGVDSKEIYPVRHQLKRLVVEGYLFGMVRPHMGGRRFHSAKTSYRSDGLRHSQRQFHDYAQQLRSCRISLCCTSKYHYALEKLIQSAMSGAVIMSDLPNDSNFRQAFGDNVLVVRHGVSNAEIVDLAESVLDNGSEWEQRSTALRAAALDGYTMEHYADKYVDAVRNCD